MFDLNLEPLCGTFTRNLWNLHDKPFCEMFMWNLYVEPWETWTFMWNQGTFKSGTFVWNLWEPELSRVEPLFTPGQARLGAVLGMLRKYTGEPN